MEVRYDDFSLFFIEGYLVGFRSKDGDLFEVKGLQFYDEIKDGVSKFFGKKLKST